MNERNSEKFFKNIEIEIENLANAYGLVSDEIDKLKQNQENQNLKTITSNENVEFTMLLKLLNRAITSFKREMAASLNDYFYMKDAGILREQSATHIKMQIDILRKRHKEFTNKQIPDDLLKKVLGRNYYFHQNIKKLTSETILEYFEMNYAMMLDEKTED